ncbi:HNH endonuclease family protein [Brevibacillus laterosporus GI-9]|uniref:type II CRISPR RNA-guided endonuclease Cas9 n=1 Tax=Brevibacillus laterosporus TaxID=1465 RepID=UPI0002403E1E|nr:type II CRISPR RNA-guided endonuclease Cas9 [Brevibacillus laterosporus]CCF15452.1 HNH endonuclease family protein [Brevibacillus laterosporus GI-9]
MAYTMGIDVGIASCGWAIVDLERQRIIDIGVRTFEKAENPKNGEALAVPRREARSSRRRLRRKKHRIERLKYMFVRNGLAVDIQHLEQTLRSQNEIDVWQLRVDGLDRMLTQKEWLRVLIHLAQRRGFQSNRKTDGSSEDGQVLVNVTENDRLMEEKDYRTVAEMMVKDEKFSDHKRNKNGNYHGVVSRASLLVEIHTLFESQRQHHNFLASKDFELEYINIWSSQRPVATKDQIEKMIGTCTFLPKEKRAPKASWHFQYFMLLQTINHIRITNAQGTRPLNKEEIEQVVNMALTKSKVSYHDIRKVLDLSEEYQFVGLDYGKEDEKKKVESKETIIKLDDYHKLNKIFNEVELAKGETWEAVDYDTVAYALTFFKDDEDIRDYLQNKYKDSKNRLVKNVANKEYTNELIEKVSTLSFRKVGHLSLKALRKIIPFLEQGMTYDKACQAAGFNFQGISKKKRSVVLPVIDQISNPVVNRALTQTRKVINALIKKYGSPETIHIETARELSKRFDERKNITKDYKENRDKNERAKKHLSELGIINPTGLDIVKYKLWCEQQGRCMYSNQPISFERLRESGYTEVDHIIPYSRSMNDSYNNRVLVMTRENREKSNQTPYEYMGNDTQRWDEFEQRVTTNPQIKKEKRQNLLLKGFTNRRELEMLERNLNDTRHITKYLSHFISTNLEFSPSDKKKKVVNTSGRITSHLRSRWGLEKNREQNDLHHAMDAVVIAVTSDSFIQQVTNYYKRKERRELNGDDKFPLPWKFFREEVIARLSPNPKEQIEALPNHFYSEDELADLQPIFVSRMPKRSITGEAHQAQFRRVVGKTKEGKNITAKKTALVDISYDKNGDFNMYGRETDPATYEAIKERYLEFGGNAKKAFSTDLHKPKKDGTKGPLIKSVRIMENKTLVHPVNKGKGVVYNSSIVRTDVFQRKEKYYLLPVYVTDVTKGKLPNKVIAAKKGYDDWIEVDDSFTFLYSLYPNDLIFIRQNPKKKISLKKRIESHSISDSKEVQEILTYYKGVDSSTAAIEFITHDGSYYAKGVGVQNLDCFEKYQVDILGNYSKVKGEKRLELETSDNNHKGKDVNSIKSTSR